MSYPPNSPGGNQVYGNFEFHAAWPIRTSNDDLSVLQVDGSAGELHSHQSLASTDEALSAELTPLAALVSAYVGRNEGEAVVPARAGYGIAPELSGVIARHTLWLRLSEGALGAKDDCDPDNFRVARLVALAVYATGGRWVNYIATPLVMGRNDEFNIWTPVAQLYVERPANARPTD